MNNFLKEFLTEENIGAGSYTEFLDKTLGKLDLNQQIADSVLKQTLVQKKVADYKSDLIKAIAPIPSNAKVNKDGFYRDPTAEEQKKVLLENIVLIRQYFKAIYDNKVQTKKSIYNPKEKKYEEKDAIRELGTKELLFLMLGEFNCFTIQDLIEIGSRKEFEKLKLDNEQRIKTFFAFIGNDIDPVTVISDLKKQACPPDPCEKIEDEIVEEVQNKIGEICKVLNLKQSGLPPIPINEILKAVGLQDLFNQGVKEQFNQLKTEQLLFLGFPSISNYPRPQDISPFLPKENGVLTDYDLWNEKKVNNEKIFKDYFLRGGPPLKWKYDDVDINKNLVGSTLEDVCGEEETFTETFIHIFNDVFKIDFNKIQKTLEAKKTIYKDSYSKRVQLEYEKRQSGALTDSQLQALEDEKKKNNKGTFDDDEEGLVKDLAELYKKYKSSYDEQQASKDRLRNWILGVRKDAGYGWEGIDVFNFVNSDMGYGEGHAQKIYEQLNADDYDF
jgi:hypothetical protein